MLRAMTVAITMLLTGCVDLALDGERGSSLVPADLFGTRPVSPAARNASFTPASTHVSQRVDRVGREILAANPEIGLKPYFATIGDPKEEIFHDGTKMVWITSGLVDRCRGDSDLAALLSLELAKMAADRELLASPSLLDADDQLPIRAPVGNSSRYDSADRTYLFELARADQRRKERRAKKRPDVKQMARKYLKDAGFQERDLDAIDPLVRAARKNYVFEKQFRQAGHSQWQSGS